MDGISFVVRVRNEEQTLEQSLRSLKGLRIQHEIVVILHLCTDRSKEIAESLMSELPIRIIEYNIPVSRAGYENMVTDAESQHSLVTYYNWSFSHAKYIWKFKWDADFIASVELCEYLNSNSWGNTDATKVYFVAKSVDAENVEGYLFNGNTVYKKYYFWEFLDGQYIPRRTNIQIEHASKLSEFKSYWNEDPWFYNSNSEEAKNIRKKYEILSNICGKELVGQARASNPQGANIEWNVKCKEPMLTEHGIYSLR